MGKYDFEEEPSDSDSDSDDFLQDHIADISAVFFPTKPSGDDEADDDDDNDNDDENGDDLELVRNIKGKYRVGDDISNPMTLKPLATLLPVDSDDDEDDFETLRAIQRRFSQYCGSEHVDGDDAIQSKSEKCVEKSSLDDATCVNSGDERVDVCINVREQSHCSTSESKGTSNQTPNFPKSAQTFIEAIKKNRSCQKFLRNKLLHTEARMEENKDLQMKIKTVKDYQVRCKKVIGRASSQKSDPLIQLILVPKQRPDAKGARKNLSPMCYGPAENSHVANLRAAFEKIPLLFKRNKWSTEESGNLEKGVVQQLQKMLIEKSDVLSDDVVSLVKNFEITPEIIRAFAGNVNWEELASTYIPCCSGAECAARWFNHEDKLINKGDWTSMEEKQLLLLIKHYGLDKWALVAENLNTNRTPFMCLEHYQRSLNPSMLKREWTEDEDAQLCFAVACYGESNWQVVADTLEGRTGTQCSNRWKKTLHPARKRVGKWIDDEDKRLKVAAALFGNKNWYKIAQFVPGRTQVQCRERWCNVLDSSLKRGDWTEEEDLKLKAAIVEHGYFWSRIATCVLSRTDNQCRRRWKILFPHEVPLLQAARREQKDAFISNFVDRESERPALVALPIEGPMNEHENGNLPQKRKKSRKSKRSDLDNEPATVSVPKDPSKKRRKKAKSSEIEMLNDNDDVVRNNEGHILTSKGRTSKSSSKEMACSGSVNVVAGPKIKPGKNLESRKRDCRNRAKSPEIGMTSDVTDAEQSDGLDVVKYRKMMTCKSDSEKRKCSESIGIATKCKKKSSESKKSNGAEDIETWDMPIKLWSRRARRVCLKDIASPSGCKVGQATTTGTTDTNENTANSKLTLEEENTEPEIQHDKPLGSNPTSKTSDTNNIGDFHPVMDDLTMKASSKQKPQRKAPFESNVWKFYKRRCK